MIPEGGLGAIGGIGAAGRGPTPDDCGIKGERVGGGGAEGGRGTLEEEGGTGARAIGGGAARAIVGGAARTDEGGGGIGGVARFGGGGGGVEPPPGGRVGGLMRTVSLKTGFGARGGKVILTVSFLGSFESLMSRAGSARGKSLKRAKLSLANLRRTGAFQESSAAMRAGRSRGCR